MGDSVQVAPLVSNRRVWFSSGLPWWQAAALVLLTAWLYGPILARLFLQWVGPKRDPNFEHGIFVPAFALFVLWQNRHKLKSIELHPSWAGLPLIICALLMAAVGVLGAENFTSRVSLLLLLAGLIILFGGWRLFRAVLFPWAFLFLMIPIPAIIFQQITFPLQMLASKVASGLLPLLGVPVLREGNVITLAAMPLEVAEACSGIRSLLSLVTLAIIYGYLMDSRKWVQVLLAFSAVPIAVMANSFRIVGTGLLVQYWSPDKAMGFFHGFEGWLIFLVSLVMLFGLHQIILRLSGQAPDVATTTAQPANGPTSRARTNGSQPRFVVVAVLMAVTALSLEARSRNEVLPKRESLSSLPSQLGAWTGSDQSIDQQQLDILGAGEFLLRDYTNSIKPQPPIGLFLAYFPSQKAGDTIHSPNHCLPGAGWVPVQRRVIQIGRPDGYSFPANRYVISKSGERALVLYWYLAHDRAVASEYWAKYYLVADSIRMNRSDGALVRLITPIYGRETPDAAQARVMNLGSQLIPILNNYIPR
jgi:exosortase D (VPLPA-CTERM-specific)